jgi:glycosyltransferase XagB
MGLELRQRATLARIEAMLRPLAAETTDRLYSELDCIRDRLDPRTLHALERRARDLGVTGDRVLIASGIMDKEQYVRALADWLDLPFDTLETHDRRQCPLDDQRLLDVPASDIVPVWIERKLNFVVAPRGMTARRLSQRSYMRAEIPGRIRLTTDRYIDHFVRRHAEAALGGLSTQSLQQARPDLSAGPGVKRRSFVPALVAGTITAVALIVAPGPVLLAFEIVLALIFLAWMLLRVAGALVRPTPARTDIRLSDAELPTYTILISLYREVAAIPDLVEALRELDYPPEKLDIKFVTEPDDVATRHAIETLRLDTPFEIFVAPADGPRTKPKALNAALPFARGTFTVIYDAEDRPEPGQLRQALDAFRDRGEQLACVQASLTIDNAADNWLTGFFAAEYAGHFDVFLPALALLEQPLPLGGSSNHFRTATLREVGAWDPYNVTEDADLGIRLARFGYRTTSISSCTYEEAPARAMAWLKQRTRWFKGWMQTWLVHMRAPLRLRRDIGTAAFVTVQLIVGGNVLAALVHPLLLALIGASLFSDTPLWSTIGTTALFAVAAIAGYFASAVLCLVGLRRRGLMHHAWVLLLMPIYWLMLALAAWRALYQLIWDPYRWEKTEHGLARTSRMATPIKEKAGDDAPALVTP